MEANELRIGNLVFDKKNNRFKEITIIKGDFNYNLYYEPIQLTKKILLDSGFKETKPCGWYEKDGISLFSPAINPPEFEFCNEISTKIIKYVHQIQNLFFVLKDKELIIKLS